MRGGLCGGRLGGNQVKPMYHTSRDMPHSMISWAVHSGVHVMRPGAHNWRNWLAPWKSKSKKKFMDFKNKKSEQEFIYNCNNFIVS